MSARADFACLACGEEMELPLKAAACPVCGGLLERRFTTAPAVIRGAQQGIEAVRAPVLENAAADEFNAQKAARSVDPRFKSEAYNAGPISQTVQSSEGMKIGVPAMINALSPTAKMGTREGSIPVLWGRGGLRGLGPSPGPGSKSS